MNQAASQHIPQSEWQKYNPSSYQNVQSYQNAQNVQGYQSVQNAQSYQNAQNIQNIPPFDEHASRISNYEKPIKSEFGKIKGIEVLGFKEAELEKTFNGITKFNSVGVLQVLYFPIFDRFVLSLKDWKYALLKRLPVIAAENAAIGPISYTFPTYNGSYTLTFPKIQHYEGLKNLETIFINNSKFSGKGAGDPMALSGGEMQMSPQRYGTYGSLEGAPANMGGFSAGESPRTSLDLQPGTLTKGQKWKRGFKKFGYLFSGKMSHKEKLNLNNYQSRDIETLKNTNEVMAPFYLYPRREVERWIIYNKEVANSLGFLPEGYTEGQSSIMGESRMRGYGSVDLGQGSLSNPVSFREGGISMVRPPVDDLGYSAGQNYTVPPTKSNIRWTDKVKSKIPGTHHYYGERTPLSQTYSHSIHPGVSQRLGQSIGTPLSTANPGLIAVASQQQSQIPITQSTVLEEQNISPPIEQTSAQRQGFQTYMEPRPVGEAYYESLKRDFSPNRQGGESYTQQSFGQIPHTTSQNYEYRTVGQISPSQVLREPQEVMKANRYAVPTDVGLAQSFGQTNLQSSDSIRTGAFATTTTIPKQENYIEDLTGRITGLSSTQGGAGYANQPIIGQAINTTQGVESTIARENEELPSLAQRIRNTPSKPAGLADKEKANSPSFTQRIKNMFTGRNENDREVAREVTNVENQVITNPQIEIIREQNAHYQA